MTRIGRRIRFWYSQGHRRHSQGHWSRLVLDVENPVVGENLVVGEFVREYQRSHFWPFQGHWSLFEGDRATLANWNHSEGNNQSEGNNWHWRSERSGKRMNSDSTWR